MINYYFNIYNYKTIDDIIKYYHEELGISKKELKERLLAIVEHIDKNIGNLQSAEKKKATKLREDIKVAEQKL